MGKLAFGRPKLRIAFVAFNKHIASELQAKLNGPRTLFTGTDEQEEIWQEALEGEQHILVNACAGSGKTATGLQYCYRANGQAEAMTYHALGFRALRSALGKVDVDQYKVDGILDVLNVPVRYEDEKACQARIRQLVGLCKQYGRQDRESLEWIVDAHDMDLNGMEEVVLEWTPKVLKRCRDMTHIVDFDDMVWLPKELGLSLPQWDVMITDEAQDLSAIQQWCALHAAERHIVVGDRRQAIYAFRGADSRSMERMRGELEQTRRGVRELPLTLTRRCPQSHVRLAQRMFEGIRALPEAAEGSIRSVTVEQAIGEMAPGDLVLCRVNADLLSVAYRLLRRHVAVQVRGRDIGQGMVRLIERCEKRARQQVIGTETLLRIAGELTADEVRKFESMQNGRGAMRASAAKDRYECLSELAHEVETSMEVKRIVEQLFAETGQAAVVLGTVHRTKGLEAERVYILRPELIPHPMAKRREEQEQERNIGYIAVTRSKRELLFVGGESPLFVDAESVMREVEEEQNVGV